MNNIFISTVAFAGMDIDSIITKALEHQLNIEFSSGLPYNADMGDIFLKAPIRRMPHNYFPAPADPFVLNLASGNNAIRQRSISMCRDGLHLAKGAGSPFYAAHAGFCIDPKPTQLGQQLAVDQYFDKNTHWEIFLRSVTEILEVADQLEMDFLIENNVIAQFNIAPNGMNPLFCCDTAEMSRLLEDIRHPRLGILLDTAHLKVSAITLGFDMKKAFKAVSHLIRGIHHSDNDGMVDNNQPLTANYWCGSLLQPFRNTTHVIEVKSLTIGEVFQQIALLQNFLTNSYES
jgi:sugar phosphate isomerase/epimerase